MSLDFIFTARREKVWEYFGEQKNYHERNFVVEDIRLRGSLFSVESLAPITRINEWRQDEMTNSAGTSPVLDRNRL